MRSLRANSTLTLTATVLAPVLVVANISSLNVALPSRKLRGFKAGKIGPIDGGDYVGGNYVTSFNAKAMN